MLLRTALGASLRRLRDARGLRLVDVAERARLSVAYVSEVERGRKEASSEVVAALCDALDVPLTAVLRETGDRLARAATPLPSSAPRTGAPQVVDLTSRIGAPVPQDTAVGRHESLLRAA
ncbi:MAG TPA: helix-turn-helix transcriptional regulator [Cellulomonas sp.]